MRGRGGGGRGRSGGRVRNYRARGEGDYYRIENIETKDEAVVTSGALTLYGGRKKAVKNA